MNSKWPTWTAWPGAGVSDAFAAVALEPRLYKSVSDTAESPQIVPGLQLYPDCRGGASREKHSTSALCPAPERYPLETSAGTVSGAYRFSPWLCRNAAIPVAAMENSVMLAIIAGILIVLWLLGFLAFHVGGGLIHILLVVAVIAVIIHFVTGRRAV